MVTVVTEFQGQVLPGGKHREEAVSPFVNQLQKSFGVPWLHSLFQGLSNSKARRMRFSLDGEMTRSC